MNSPLVQRGSVNCFALASGCVGGLGAMPCLQRRCPEGAAAAVCRTRLQLHTNTGVLILDTHSPAAAAGCRRGGEKDLVRSESNDSQIVAGIKQKWCASRVASKQ